MQHLITRAEIESNKAFQRLIDKTQVLTPKTEMKDIFRNRLTHSYEVATSAEIIAHSISTHAFDADYQKSVYNVSLLHDIGHPPFGHEGAQVLNKYFKEAGLEEGFSDNNNNLVIIQKDQIKVSDYELASLIKYPEKLYKSQEGYKNLLKKSIDADIAYFKDKITINNRPKRTLACTIMDEADRNTYICTDLTDAYSIGILDVENLQKLLDSDQYNNVDILNFLSSVIIAVQQKNKTLIKKAFSELKTQLNQNYYLAPDLELRFRDKELFEFRELLYGIDLNYYINSEHVQEIKEQGRQYLRDFIKIVIEENFYPSNYYSKRIDKAESEKEKLTLIRDMIANSTDNFIRNRKK